MTQSIEKTIQDTTTEQTFTHLKCRECGETYELGAKHVCEDVCFGPLEVTYDYDLIRRRVSREHHSGGATLDLALQRLFARHLRAAY
jgi:threonine synthase